MSTLASLAIMLGFAYAALVVFTYLRQDAIIYYPGQNHPEAVAALAPYAWKVDTGDVTLRGWKIPATAHQNSPLVLYFGGNAEDVAITAYQSQRDATYLYVNYRGYGGTAGRPSEQALKTDALAIYDAAISDAHAGKVIAIGRSLGSGVAVYLAAHRPIDALVLITPFDSLVNVAHMHYPWLPVRWLLRHRFESARLAAASSAPALFLIADGDTIIPAERGLELARAWGGPTEVTRFPGAGHNDIDNAEGFAAALSAFLARQRVDDSSLPQ